MSVVPGILRLWSKASCMCDEPKEGLCMVLGAATTGVLYLSMALHMGDISERPRTP